MPTSVIATTLFIVDQNNNPVINAVVSMPSPSNFIADTQKIAVMDQVNRQFLPEVLIINKGQSVAFPNSDDIRHHVYSFSTVKPFEIKLYKGSSQEPISFDKSGVSVLGCNIHDNMVGHIYIADNEIALKSNQDGLIEYEGVIPKTISLWHPKLSVGAMAKQTLEVTTVNDQAVVKVELIVPKINEAKRRFGSRSKYKGS